MKSDFEERREKRIEGGKARAVRLVNQADAALDQAREMASVIPLGQPILVGHHSEKRDRAYRGKIENKFQKAHDLHTAAEEAERRAIAAANNTAIFSDDPNAAVKLEDKIARLEKRQEMMKQANKLVRKNDRAGLAEMGFSERQIDQLFAPDCFNYLGFAPYLITNNGANIRRLKERLKSVVVSSQQETKTSEINGIKIVENVEDNRLQMFFDGKPPANIRDMLKQNGFRWAPSVGAWQRHLTNSARYYAVDIAKKMV